VIAIYCIYESKVVTAEMKMDAELGDWMIIIKKAIGETHS
jgi:hypothetical protein